MDQATQPVADIVLDLIDDARALTKEGLIEILSVACHPGMVLVRLKLAERIARQSDQGTGCEGNTEAGDRTEYIRTQPGAGPCDRRSPVMSDYHSLLFAESGNDTNGIVDQPVNPIFLGCPEF